MADVILVEAGTSRIVVIEAPNAPSVTVEAEVAPAVVVEADGSPSADVALAHTLRTDNPHGVTPAQIGALPDSNAAFTARYKAWMASLPTTPTAVGEPYNMGGIPAIAQP